MADFLTEAQFCDAVVGLARLNGLLVHHCRPARTATGWRTPIQGSAGFVDLVIVGTRVLYRELKTAGGRVSPEQEKWLTRLTRANADAAVWRPEDWPARILTELRGIKP